MTKKPRKKFFCEICGKEFEGKHSWPSYKAATCSRECLCKKFSKMNSGIVRSDEQKEKIRATLIRKGIKPPAIAIERSREALKNPEVRARMGRRTESRINQLKRLAEFNTGRKRAPHEIEAVRAANSKSEKFKSHLVNMIKMGNEACRNDPRFQPGIQNIFCRRWHLRSPTGKEYHFKNVRDFISNNPKLFDPEDVEWRERVILRKGVTYKKNYCRALSLMALRPSKISKRQMATWKGWTWISATENHNDLLDRTLLETNI